MRPKKKFNMTMRTRTFQICTQLIFENPDLSAILADRVSYVNAQGRSYLET